MLRSRTLLLAILSTFSLTALLSGAPSSEETWGLNDVSYLLPLPSAIDSGDDLETLRPRTRGAGGELLPATMIDLFPQLAPEVRPHQAADMLRVVGARIDPCFRPAQSPHSGPCRPQLRMVLQPILKGPDGIGNQVTTADAAVHVFYELSREEFRSLARALAAIRPPSSTPSLALDVHPQLASEGLTGPFWKSLKSLLLRYSGAARISRATFMTTVGRGNVQWEFGGFEVVNGQIERLIIPRVNDKLQTFTNAHHMVSMWEFRGGMRPQPSGEDTLNRVLLHSTKLAEADLEEVKLAALAAGRIENPRVHTSETLDCASCHAAQAVRLWTGRRFPQALPSDSSATFVSRYNLKNQSPREGQTQVVRAFGYFGTDAAVSQRVINESAAVAEQLSHGNY